MGEAMVLAVCAGSVFLNVVLVGQSRAARRLAEEKAADALLAGVKADGAKQVAAAHAENAGKYLAACRSIEGECQRALDELTGYLRAVRDQAKR